MNQFKLSELAQGRKGSRVLLPAINERLGTIQTYRIELNKMLRALARNVKENVLPELQNFKSINDGMVRDDDVGLIQLSVETESLIEEVSAIVTLLLTVEIDNHTAKFIRGANGALGIDLTAVIRDEDLTEYLGDAVRRNVGLIQSLGRDATRDIERLVLQNKVNGGSISSLRRELTKSFFKSRQRAELIATDQTQKLTADLNQIRQQQAGIDNYEWSTSADERVRSLHRGLDGNVYKWTQSTGAEGGQHPGQPIRCRCVARAIVQF